jgi:glycosyltransferase involved in cell wall biosynthesis
MKIRVLRIINRLVIGGPAYNVSYLTKYLEPEFETILLSGPKEESEVDSDFIPRQMGIEPMYIKDMQKSLTKPWKDVKAYKEIKKVIEDFKPHIVHTHASKSGFLGRLVALDCKVPIILHTFHGHYFHSYFHPIKTKTLLTIERILSSKTEGIIAISPEQFKDLSEVYKVDKPSKIYEIPLGFDLDRFTILQDEKRIEFRKEFGLKDDDVAIAIIGRMVPIKNHSLFNNAIPAILATLPKNVKFFYIGDGELRNDIENELRTLNVPFTTEIEKDNSKPVIFTSWRKDMEVVYAGLDIVALTSFNEGTPVSIIEAQAAKKAVICTEVGGLNYVVDNNETAILIPSNDLNALVENLKLLIQDKAKRTEMGEKGWLFVQSKFSYKRLVSDMRSLYLKLLQEKGIEI